ncbi:MAG: hypothetical protein ACFFB0_08275 [Promethearchaeota archaeon]
MTMKKIKKKKQKWNKLKPKIIEGQEYGVVLKKEKKFRHRIYPQKGKVPEDDTDDYEIV